MNLREAPYLPAQLDTTRRSLYKARMTLSGLGWDEWPDPYLAMLSRYGFDSIYASVYVNPNGVNGPPPYWDRMKKQDPARVHDLIRRAARYGIDLYCPIVYVFNDDPESEAGLRKLVRDIVTEFPEIRGYILLTEGFFYKTWFGAGGQEDRPEGLGAALGARCGRSSRRNATRSIPRSKCCRGNTTLTSARRSWSSRNTARRRCPWILSRCSRSKTARASNATASKAR